MITITSIDAQNSFGQLLEAAQRETVAIMRHDRPVAFVVSPRDMDELLDARCRRSKAVADLEAWSADPRNRSTPAADALTDDDITRLVHESR